MQKYEIEVLPLPKTEEEFLKERKLGIGSSDLSDLLSLEPYGCLRRLYLDKLGGLPESEAHNFHLERGRFFEAPVAELYRQKTKLDTYSIGPSLLKEFPFLRANADRILEDKERGLGVLEIKVPSSWSFKKIKKEGLPEAYLLQLQWQMLCYGTSWGSFAVFWPDGFELLHFDVERDDELIAMLIEKAKAFWEMKDTAPLPPVKEKHYSGCKNCSAFALCHEGTKEELAEDVQVDPTLTQFALRYSQIGAQIKGLETEKELLKETFEEAFLRNKSTKLTSGGFFLSTREQTKETVSSKVIEVLTEEEKKKYCKQSSYSVLTVKGKTNE